GGGAEPLREVAAAAEAGRLERAQLGVTRAVAAGDPFAAHAVTRDDPLPLEQQLGERSPVRRGGEQPLGCGPAPLRRGRRPGAAAREAAGPPFLRRQARFARGAGGRPPPVPPPPP